MMRFLLVFIITTFSILSVHSAESLSAQLGDQQKKYNEGHYKEVLSELQRLIRVSKSGTDQLAETCNLSFECLQRLNQVSDLDSWREEIVEQHKNDWRVLKQVAHSYAYAAHYGYMVKGAFQRGHHRGGGTYMNAEAHDRVQALRLLYQAHLLEQKDKSGKHEHVRRNLYTNFASAILGNQGPQTSWKLQTRTDLKTDPEIEEHHYTYNSGNARGAAVHEDGSIVFYKEPETWAAAKNDGERWRWCLQQLGKISPDAAEYALTMRADYCLAIYGVQTMSQYGLRLPKSEEGDDAKQGPWSVEALPDNESIARLAVGVRRFNLENEFNYIALYKALDEKNGNHAWNARNQLGSIYLNRRQYAKALHYYKLTNNNDQIKQITGALGVFEPTQTQAAETANSVVYKYRNGKRVTFTAHAIKVEALLEDVKTYVKSKPKRLDWQHLNISNIGHRLVQDNQEKYIGEQVAEWSLDLNPSKKHFDRFVTVQTPMQKAGAYLLLAKIDGGNTARVIMWLNDTILLQKRIHNQQMYYVADAKTGKGLEKLNVSFFGYNQRHIKNNNYQINHTEFAEFSDQDGFIYLGNDQLSSDYQWLAIARNDQGRLAYLGFQHFWYGQYHVNSYQAHKTFFMTDRPVYRPGQSVKIKAWLRRPSYEQGEESAFAEKPVTLLINNGKGEKILEHNYTCDAYGGFEASLDLPDDANLGQYRMYVKHHGGGQGNFRVEEYKKPEFEVTVDAPREPIALGDTFKATINARYYFGAPVTEGTVKYKVHRSGQDKQWYPSMPWDWFYGQGYWWFAPDYSWYPGFKHWGCRAPYPWWFPQRNDPPELVLDTEAELGEDGTVSFEIDTSLAQAMQADKDHVYKITAEVVDKSRRTIVGSGSITAARKPFQISMWLNRGYYNKGETIQVSAAARSIDDKPIHGEGQLSLYLIKYNEKREAVETEIGTWPVATDANGDLRHQLTAGETGQYRLSYVMKDKQQRDIEGAYLFGVIGETAQDQDFKFNDLEIILDKQTYAPGDEVQVLINSERRMQDVLLFVRPVNGLYKKAQVITLEKRSQIVPLNVTIADMPNFFIEAVCVSNGRVHVVAKEVIVPPASRVLDVEIKPTKERYLPGEKASLTVTLMDENGEPFVGSTVLSIYDKALEYISGGSNVGDIKAHFWKWRRRHNPQTMHNALNYFTNMVKNGETYMRQLGVFGYLAESDKDMAEAKGDRRGKKEGAGGRQMAMKSSMAAAPMASAMDGVANEMEMSDDEMAAPGESGADQLVEPQVRSNFADTALWVANVTTNEKGEAEFSVDMPENLSTWMIKVWSMGHGTRVGQGQHEIITSKNLIVRMQAPRFFVEKDEVVLSAIVHNYLDTEKEVSVQLEIDGGQLISADKLIKTAKIPAGGEARIDWRMEVVGTGEVCIRMKALSDEESDAMEMKFPVKIHGIDKTESFSVALRPDEKQAQIEFTIPEQRLPERSHIEFRYSPSLAGAMVDALPYLLEYPYGCTEQTLNRFLPSVITQNILLKMGLDLADIREKQTNLNAQQIGDAKERAAQWQQKNWKVNPVFDQAEMQKIVKTGVQKLTAMQLSDGGWGWFSGWGEHSSPHTTATVVHGLQVAKANDVALVPNVLERGVAWMRTHQDKRLSYIMEDREHHKANDTDALVFMVLTDSGFKDAKMQEVVFEDRLKMSVYAQSMLGLAMHTLGDANKWQTIKKNLEQYLKQDDENQTAWLNLPNTGYWWYWYGSEIETHAYFLKLLSKTDPKSETASRLVKYMLNNRQNATYWNSTRDTALCIEALADYMRASGEDTPDMHVEILYDDKVVKTVAINKDNLFSFDNVFALDAEAVTGGKHTISVRKQGTGPLYTNAYVSYFTKEDHITAAGLEVKIERDYYKLVQNKDATQKQAGTHGQVLEQKTEKYTRVKINNLDEIQSGDLVEIELTLHSKNDYEYIAIEDLKAAGFEPVDQRSGYVSAGIRAYRELRDDRVTFFVQNLARGSHSLQYRMRAEIPGKFSALPSRVYAMYAPELRGNAEEIKIKIRD